MTANKSLPPSLLVSLPLVPIIYIFITVSGILTLVFSLKAVIKSLGLYSITEDK